MSLKIFCLALISAVFAAAESPLTVSDVVTGPSSHVKLTNTGAQPVTAWSLAATSTSDGRTHREVYSSDGYLSEVTHGLPGANERLERLMPGESRQLPLDPLPAGTTVEVVAAVLADGTALGDEQAIAAIFAHRAKERDALKAVVDAFNDVLPARHGAEALTALRAVAFVVHGHTSLVSSIRVAAGSASVGPSAAVSSARARCNRDLTVPIGQSSTVAVSA